MCDDNAESGGAHTWRRTPPRRCWASPCSEHRRCRGPSSHRHEGDHASSCPGCFPRQSGCTLADHWTSQATVGTCGDVRRGREGHNTALRDEDASLVQAPIRAPPCGGRVTGARGVRVRTSSPTRMYKRLRGAKDHRAGTAIRARRFLSVANAGEHTVRAPEMMASARRRAVGSLC